jgi:hypothetical protein
MAATFAIGVNADLACPLIVARPVRVVEALALCPHPRDAGRMERVREIGGADFLEGLHLSAGCFVRRFRAFAFAGRFFISDYRSGPVPRNGAQKSDRCENWRTQPKGKGQHLLWPSQLAGQRDVVVSRNHDRLTREKAERFFREPYRCRAAYLVGFDVLMISLP